MVVEFVNKVGWYIELIIEGEKVLVLFLIIDYKVFFIIYVFVVLSMSVCVLFMGNSCVYLVNMFNGNVVSDFNNNGDLDSGDRYVDLK